MACPDVCVHPGVQVVSNHLGVAASSSLWSRVLGWPYESTLAIDNFLGRGLVPSRDFALENQDLPPIDIDHVRLVRREYLHRRRQCLGGSARTLAGVAGY